MLGKDQRGKMRLVSVEENPEKPFAASFRPRIQQAREPVHKKQAESGSVLWMHCGFLLKNAGGGAMVEGLISCFTDEETSGVGKRRTGRASLCQARGDGIRPGSVEPLVQTFFPKRAHGLGQVVSCIHVDEQCDDVWVSSPLQSGRTGSTASGSAAVEESPDLREWLRL